MGASWPTVSAYATRTAGSPFLRSRRARQPLSDDGCSSWVWSGKLRAIWGSAGMQVRLLCPAPEHWLQCLAIATAVSGQQPVEGEPV